MYDTRVNNIRIDLVTLYRLGSYLVDLLKDLWRCFVVVLRNPAVGWAALEITAIAEGVPT